MVLTHLPVAMTTHLGLCLLLAAFARLVVITAVDALSDGPVSTLSLDHNGLVGALFCLNLPVLHQWHGVIGGQMSDVKDPTTPGTMTLLVPLLTIGQKTRHAGLWIMRF